MNVGDLVKGHLSGRIGIVLAINNSRCRIMFMDGIAKWGNTYHFRRLNNENR